jgi:hypothetical protein
VTTERDDRPGGITTETVQEPAPRAISQSTPSGYVGAPATGTPERLLLSKMLTTDGLAEVLDACLSPDVFEEPVYRALFAWITQQYWPEAQAAPTVMVVEHEFPTAQLPHPSQVREATSWLIGSLQQRHALNHAQELMISTAKTLHDDPVGTLRRLAEEVSAVLDQAGRIGTDDGTPRLWPASELRRATQPRWLAKNRLPRAAVSLLVGDEGIGKSLFWVYLTAAVTTGKPLLEFGVPARDPAHVIVVVTEDDWSTTVRPRLEVAGADLSMVRVICTDEDGSGAPEFPRDLHLIAQADPAPALVVVDAWLDTVPAKLVVKDPQAARQALHPWKDIPTATDAAVVLLSHTNRVNSANIRDKYGATGELRKKARMTLFAQRDDDGYLVIGPDKANTAASVTASRFEVKAVRHFAPTEDHDGTVPVLGYVGESDQTSQEHIAQAYASGHGTRGRDDVVAWLATALANGPRWSTDLYGAASEAEYSADQLKRNKLRAGAESVKDGSTGQWFWRLQGQEGTPADGQEETQGSGGVSA